MEWWGTFEIIKIAVFSLIIIYAVHQLFRFVVDTFTVTKIKNNPSSQTYSAILNSLQHTQTHSSLSPLPVDSFPSSSMSSVSGVSPIPPLVADETMEDELRNFMKQQCE